MYPNDAVASSSIPIPKTRRRYMASPLSSSPLVNSSPGEQLVRGYAHLCFCDDGSWFEGHLITKDESQYGLSGYCPRMFSSAGFDGRNDDSSTSDDMGNVNGSSPNSEAGSDSDIPFIVYDVTVNDHEDEETYQFPSVLLTSYFPLCALLSSRFSFTAEKSYRGQRADMLIQRYLTPRLVGKNLRVCAGHMTFDLIPPVPSLSNSYKGRNPSWCQ